MTRLLYFVSTPCVEMAARAASSFPENFIITLLINLGSNTQEIAKENTVSEYDKTEIDSDIENKLVVLSAEREGGRGRIGVGD